MLNFAFNRYAIDAFNPTEAVIFINLDHFDRFKIHADLEKALKNLTCSNEGWNLSAKTINEPAKEAYCDKHIVSTTNK